MVGVVEEQNQIPETQQGTCPRGIEIDVAEGVDLAMHVGDDQHASHTPTLASRGDPLAQRSASTRGPAARMRTVAQVR